MKCENKSPKRAYKLEVCLIPATTWGKNVRAIVAQDIWASIRYYFRSTRTPPQFLRPLNKQLPNNHTPLSCAICLVQSESLELHECWTFDDISLIQKLEDLIPICDSCHNVIHFGRSCQLGLEDDAFKHLCKINNWTKEEANWHIDNAYVVWATRNQKRYELDLDFLKSFLPENLIHREWLNRPKFWSGNRLEAIAWAQDRLSATDVVIIDTETTGLISGPNKNPRAEIIEAAVISIGGEVLYESRFRPKYKIPKRTTAIHGIDDEAVKDCPSFKHEYPKLESVLSGKIVIAYNDKFDSGVLAQTCAMNKLPTVDCRWECAMHIFRAFLETPKFVKLPGAKHGALSDCFATLELVKKMATGRR